MTTTRNGRLGWAGATIVALLGTAMIGGCAGGGFGRTQPPAPEVQIVQSDAGPAAEQSAAAPTTAPVEPIAYGFEVPEPVEPPQINAFGEFDGQERGPVRRTAEVGFQQHTFLDEGYDADVAVDPTGQWLVFASTRHAETADLYLQRVDGMSVVQLTSDMAEDANPVFSPDGRSIAFASTRSGDWDIYTMDADGRNVTQVTNGPMQDLHPSFSPDGMRLVYCSTGGKSGQWELWVVDLRTQEKRMIGFGLFPSWSPRTDVDRIAFQRARHRGSRWFSIWTVDLIDGEARRQTEVAVSPTAALVSPAWSADGRRIVYTAISEPGRAEIGKSGGAQDVWTVADDGTNRQRLTDGAGVHATPYWGPDNRIYFVSDRGGSDAVWSVQAPSGGVVTGVAAKGESQDAHAAEPHEQQDIFGSVGDDLTH